MTKVQRYHSTVLFVAALDFDHTRKLAAFRCPPRRPETRSGACAAGPRGANKQRVLVCRRWRRRRRKIRRFENFVLLVSWPRVALQQKFDERGGGEATQEADGGFPAFVGGGSGRSAGGASKRFSLNPLRSRKAAPSDSMATAPSPWWEHCGVVNGMGIDHPTRGLGYVVGFNIVRDGVLVEFSDGESHCYQERSWAKLSAAASKDVEVRTLDRMPQPRSMHDMKAFVKEFEDAEMDARKGTNFRRRATAAVVNLTGMKSLKRRHSLGGKVDYWGTGSRKKALRANLKGRELRQHSARVINRFMKHQFDTKRMVSKIGEFIFIYTFRFFIANPAHNLTGSPVAYDLPARQDIVMVTHELKRKRRGCHALLRFISFAVLFFTIITLQKKPWHAYSVEKSLLETGQKIRFFENDDYGWEDIASVDDVKKWVKSALAKLHVKGDAAALRTRDPSNTYVANYNHVVGGIAIRQWRYSRAACDNVYPRAYIPEYAVECQDGENLVIDYLGDRTPFGVNGSKFVWSDEWENGFAQMIDLGVYGSTKEQSVAAWDRLLADGWMDQETREMRLSMVTFNGNLGLFGMLNVQFYFHRGGHISRVQSVSSVVVANTYTYPDWIRVGFEIVFVGWTFGQLWKTAALWCRNPLHFWTKFFNIINVVAYTNLTASFVMWTCVSLPPPLPPSLPRVFSSSRAISHTPSFYLPPSPLGRDTSYACAYVPVAATFASTAECGLRRRSMAPSCRRGC